LNKTQFFVQYAIFDETVIQVLLEIIKQIPEGAQDDFSPIYIMQEYVRKKLL
jgi:hypothetical protein